MEGIVIKTMDYKEKSKLVYLYTPFGITSLKVFDAKKKSTLTTTLSLVEYQASNASLPIITEYHLLKSFYSLNESLPKIGVLIPMLDIIFHLEQDAPHKRIYPFFLTCLEELEKTNVPQLLLGAFLIKMLAVFGVKPNFLSCVRCGSSSITSFSIVEGGGLCEVCAPKGNTDLFHDLKYLYYAKDFNFQEVKERSEDILDAIYKYYQVHANFKVKGYQL